MRIVEGQKKSDEAQQSNRMRLGYMGHLTLIAEEVVKFTERHPPEFLSNSVLDKVMNEEWISYVEVTLTETRERDNAILGGVRPDMINPARSTAMNIASSSNFSGQSSALAEAGLNGGSSLDGMDLSNGNTNSTTFGITSGSNILSGFGSSSDEEDEEMEETEDDIERRENSGAEVGVSDLDSSLDPVSSIPPHAPNLDFEGDEDIDYEMLERLDRETPLFPHEG